MVSKPPRRQYGSAAFVFGPPPFIGGTPTFARPASNHIHCAAASCAKRFGGSLFYNVDGSDYSYDGEKYRAQAYATSSPQGVRHRFSGPGTLRCRADFVDFMRGLRNNLLPSLTQEKVDSEGWIEHHNRGASWARATFEAVQRLRIFGERQATSGAFTKDEGYPVKSLFSVRALDSVTSVDSVVVTPAVNVTDEKVKDAKVTANRRVDESKFAESPKVSFETKNHRTINAYPDEIKAALGPLTRMIEKLYFSERNPLARNYVKNIPVLLRPAFCRKRFGNNPCVIADFSSFECAMRDIFAAEICEWLIHMGGNLCDRYYAALYRELFNGINHSYFSCGIHTWVPQTLMSGAPWTSLGNAILSSCLVMYLRICEKHTEPGGELWRYYDEVCMVAEGDDTISLGGAYDPVLVEVLGFCRDGKHASLLKSCTLERFSDGDFCGITMTPRVENLITDPVKTISNFFVFPKKYYGMRDSKMKGLLRAKALSYYYQYRRCPMVSAMCYRVLQLTSGFKENFSVLSAYQRDKISCISDAGKFYMEAPKLSVVDTAAGSWSLPTDEIDIRVNFAKMYKISLPEQLDFEKEILSWTFESSRGIKLPEVFRPFQKWTSENAIQYHDKSDVPPCRLSQLLDQVPRRKRVLLAPLIQDGLIVECAPLPGRRLNNPIFRL